METQANKFPPILLWTAGIAVILFCAAGIAAFMGWIPTSTGGTSDSVMLDQHSANMPNPVAQRTLTAPMQVANNMPAPARARCAECGVIESMREIEVRGEGTGLGAVGGAVVGGVVGHQVGRGRGNDVATVLGAVGGAMAGNQIEKQAKSTKSYEITVRFDDGSSRVINEANPPTWRTGDKVKVMNGVIHSHA
jgi:outer membrane lipoprotein SlyB